MLYLTPSAIISKAFGKISDAFGNTPDAFEYYTDPFGYCSRPLRLPSLVRTMQLSKMWWDNENENMTGEPHDQRRRLSPRVASAQDCRCMATAGTHTHTDKTR